ncbi:MAG: Hpt domain-containing protein [Hyphomicrobiaceae bacterium]|nr:Hpt domain-containing protein [Hyphomicrobiaceae bacterium]
MAAEAQTVTVDSIIAPGGIERRRRTRPVGATKPVDFTYLRRFTLANRSLEREVLDLFIEHAPRYVDDLRAASTAKEWHAAAHTLKGAARGIGAWRVARVAEGAERVDFVDKDRCDFALDSADEALDEAIGFIRNIFRAW